MDKAVPGFIPFVKMTGAGNDFVLIDNRSGSLDLQWQSVAPRLCDRRYGVGADGLLVIQRSMTADFRMDYYNSDGSFGGMCGNGGRCAASFMMETLGLDSVSFDALDYRYSARRVDTEIVLSMKDPSSIQQRIQVDLPDGMLTVFFVDSGAPHAIIFLDEVSPHFLNEVEGSGIRRVGAMIRRHAKFAPAGTNVDFITIDADQSVRMRTYERGVEDETLACGTGAVASAVATALARGISPPISIRTASKEVLKVNFQRKGGSIRGVQLTGPAKVVFKGEYPLDGAAGTAFRN